MSDRETKDVRPEDYRGHDLPLVDRDRDAMVSRAMRPSFVREDKRAPVSPRYITKG